MTPQQSKGEPVTPPVEGLSLTKALDGDTPHRNTNEAIVTPPIHKSKDVNQSQSEESVDSFIRDVTQVTPRPKSEVRRRLNDLLHSTREEVVEKMKKLKPRGFGFDVASMNMGYMMALADVKHLLKEKSI